MIRKLSIAVAIAVAIAIVIAALGGFGLGKLFAAPTEQACAEYAKKQDDSFKNWLKSPKSSGW
jgi:site-specific recombinase